MPSKKRKSTGARKKKVPVKKSRETEQPEQQNEQDEKKIQKEEKVLVHEGRNEGMTTRSGSATKQEQKPFQIPLPLTRHLQLALPASKEKTNENVSDDSDTEMPNVLRDKQSTSRKSERHKSFGIKRDDNSHNMNMTSSSAFSSQSENLTTQDRQALENDLERMAREMELLKAQLNKGHSLAAKKSSFDYTGQSEKDVSDDSDTDMPDAWRDKQSTSRKPERHKDFVNKRGTFDITRSLSSKGFMNNLAEVSDDSDTEMPDVWRSKVSTSRKPESHKNVRYKRDVSDDSDTELPDVWRKKQSTFRQPERHKNFGIKREVSDDSDTEMPDVWRHKQSTSRKPERHKYFGIKRDSDSEDSDDSEKETGKFADSAETSDQELDEMFSSAHYVNHRRDNGETALHLACYWGHFAVVQLLLREGANVNQRDEDGLSPLHKAVQADQTDIIQLLIRNHANVNHLDADSSTPLFHAVYKDSPTLCELLIKRGASVNITKDNGQSPLFVAAEQGNEDVVNVLLSHNAKVNLCDKNGHSPLFTASDEGHVGVVRLLLKHKADVDLCPDDGASPLFIATDRGHADIVRLLLQKNADTSLCCHGKTPLYHASQYGQLEIVKLLLQHNADIYNGSSDFTSPLSIAAANGYYAVVEVLIKHSKK